MKCIALNQNEFNAFVAQKHSQHLESVLFSRGYLDGVVLKKHAEEEMPRHESSITALIMKTKILALIISGIGAFCLGQEPKVLEDPVYSNFLKELRLARGKSDVAATQRVADALKPIAEGQKERDRFYGANALCFYLEATSLEDPTPLLKVATIALTSPALKSDGLAWVRVVHLAAPAKAEALYKEIFEATGSSAQLAILEWLIWVRGGGYSASPFTKPGQTVTEASDALFESGGKAPDENAKKQR